MALYRKIKSGVWYYSIYVPGREKRLRGSCGTTVREEAEIVERTMRLAAGHQSSRDRLVRVIEALFDGENPDPLPISAAAFEVERIQSMSGRTLAESNIKAKRVNLRRLADWCRRNWPSVADIRDVDRACAQMFARSLAKSGTSAKTRRNLIGDLSAVWNVLAKAHDRITNPWPAAMPAPGDEGRGEAFSREEAERVFRAGDADGHGWGLAARIAAATGLRMGDVLTLRHEDISGGCIRIKPSKTRTHGISVAIPLPPDLLAMVGEGTGLVLPELGRAYRPSTSMPHPFADVLRAAGLDSGRFTFHSFRHTFRTRLAEAGVPAETAMRLGGWTQRGTAERYDHADHSAELASAVNAAWGN